MLSQIEDFVNWVRHRNPHSSTWRDSSYDLAQIAGVHGCAHAAQMAGQQEEQAGSLASPARRAEWIALRHIIHRVPLFPGLRLRQPVQVNDPAQPDRQSVVLSNWVP